MENSKSRRCDDDNDDERITATAKTVDVNHNHPSTTTTSSSSSSSYRPNLSEFVSYVTTCGFQDTTTTTTSSACGGLNTTTTTTTTPTNRSSSSCSSKSRAVSTILKGTTLSPEMRARSTDEPLAVAEDRNQQNWNDNGDIEENRLPKNEPHGQPYHHHHHHRAVSDPVYSSRHQQLQDVIVTVVTEEEEDEDDDALFFDAETAPTNTESTFIIPPLPRYPVADTRDNKKNCWSEPPVSIFTVRGVNYFTDHKKQPCDNYVLQARGSHIFLTDSKTTVNLDQM